MQRRRRAKEVQIELFWNVTLLTHPIPLEVPADRQGELKKAVAELLLGLALDQAEIRRETEIGREAEHDA